MNFFIEKVIVPLLMKTVREYAGIDSGKRVLSNSKLMGVFSILFGLGAYCMGQADAVTATATVTAGMYMIIDRNSRSAEIDTLTAARGAKSE